MMNAADLLSAVFPRIHYLFILAIGYSTFELLKLRVLNNRFYSLIARIPGYKSWPVVGDLLHLEINPPRFYKQLNKLLGASRHNGLLKLNCGMRPWVFLISPKSVEKLLHSNTLLDKASNYTVLHPWLGLGLLTSTGKKWRSRRRMLTPSFHFNILKDFLPLMTDKCQDLIDELSRESDTDVAIDVCPYITRCSLNSIMETAMGVSLDLANKAEDVKYVEAVASAKQSTFLRMRMPLLWPDGVYNLTPYGRSEAKAVKFMHDYALKVIRERRLLDDQSMSNTKYKAFLDTLLNCRDESGQLLTDDDIREEVDTFMFEGHDTVSSALFYTIHLLGAHQEHQRRCQEELSDITGEITWDDLSKMTYLEWCIKESLRIFPSVPVFGRELTEDTEFEGYLVPTGTTVLLATFILHSDPENFPNPDVFDPTRFSPDNCVGRHPYSYVPFSAGPRNCIGQKFAMMELKVTLATILRNFNIESTQKRSDIELSPGLILEPLSGIWVKLNQRA